MKCFVGVVFWLSALSMAFAQSDLPDAQTLVSKSIAYHDPDGIFLNKAIRLDFEDEIPDAAKRAASVLIDVSGQRFEMTRQSEVTVAGRIDPDTCEMTLDGKADVSDELKKEHRLSCERLKLMRNYYTYLWGLPMKLRDPGTNLGAPFSDQFNDQEALAVKVTYEPDVGGDIWYFYFDPSSYALIGYRFYRDEEKGDGEYIVLEGETQGAGLRLPKSRRWLTHQGDQWLGTDNLVKISAE